MSVGKYDYTHISSCQRAETATGAVIDPPANSDDLTTFCGGTYSHPGQRFDQLFQLIRHQMSSAMLAVYR